MHDSTGSMKLKAISADLRAIPGVSTYDRDKVAAVWH